MPSDGVGISNLAQMPAPTRPELPHLRRRGPPPTLNSQPQSFLSPQPLSIPAEPFLLNHQAGHGRAAPRGLDLAVLFIRRADRAERVSPLAPRRGCMGALQHLRERGYRERRGRVSPYTLNPQPSTLNPQPSTLNPQPCTLNPTPSTLIRGGGVVQITGRYFRASLQVARPTTLNSGP